MNNQSCQTRKRPMKDLKIHNAVALIYLVSARRFAFKEVNFLGFCFSYALHMLYLTQLSLVLRQRFRHFWKSSLWKVSRNNLLILIRKKAFKLLFDSFHKFYLVYSCTLCSTYSLIWNSCSQLLLATMEL